MNNENEVYITDREIQDFFESHYDEDTLEREYADILLGQNSVLMEVNEWQAKEIRGLRENYQSLKKVYDRVFDSRDELISENEKLKQELELFKSNYNHLYKLYADKTESDIDG